MSSEKHPLNEVLKFGKELLIKNKIEPREARLLLAHSMGISSNELIRQDKCSEEQYHMYLENLNRRIAGEPYAYITGMKEFMKLPFKVNVDTLIPRDDTEILVQKTIEVIHHYQEAKDTITIAKKKNMKIRILDMCTGSGCIAISIAKYVTNSIVDAVDISKEALKVASENAYTNNVKVNFMESDLFEKVKNTYDVIVSNPPYIVSSVIETLQQEVQSEPHIALDGGKDGLDFYRKIGKEAYHFLHNDGWLLLEIGYDQGQVVSQILKNNGYKNIEVIKDLSGNDRVIMANYNP